LQPRQSNSSAASNGITTIPAASATIQNRQGWVTVPPTDDRVVDLPPGARDGRRGPTASRPPSEGPGSQAPKMPGRSRIRAVHDETPAIVTMPGPWCRTNGPPSTAFMVEPAGHRRLMTSPGSAISKALWTIRFVTGIDLHRANRPTQTMVAAGQTSNRCIDRIQAGFSQVRKCSGVLITRRIGLDLRRRGPGPDGPTFTRKPGPDMDLSRSGCF